MNSSERIALVTGTSSGIGFHSAVALAKTGWKVFGTTRSEARMRLMVEEAGRQGAELTPLMMELSDARSIKDAVTRILESEKKIDLLVNNAGAGLGGFVYDLAMRDIETQLNVSFLGTLRVTKAVLPQMVARKSGKILVISSISGIVPIPGVGTYAASKFAIEGQFEAMRHELRDFGIEIALLEPGVYQTDIYSRNKFRSAEGVTKDSPFYEHTIQMEKFADDEVKRGHHPREVADVVVRLANGPVGPLRHPVGFDARLEYAFKKLLPQRLYENLIYSLSLGKAMKMK